MHFNNILYLSFIDAIKDCLEIIPFLLLIFYLIEAAEYFYSDKILESQFLRGNSAKFGPFFGVLLASIPQCGLSVIASTLYCKRFITKGTLIAVYLASSDEAVPVLIANPDGFRIVGPLILIKIIVGLIGGYLIDFILPAKTQPDNASELKEEITIEKGCHSHHITKSGKENGKIELFLHPLIHTLSVTFFVFLLTFLINVLVSATALDKGISASSWWINSGMLKFIEPALAAFFGIIPNCAISVGITIMYLKGAISFASCASGLCASAGLGILVLFKKNKDIKDTLSVMALLLLISILAGYVVQTVLFLIKQV